MNVHFSINGIIYNIWYGKQTMSNELKKIFMYKTISQKLWHIPYMGKYRRVKNWQMDGSESFGE